MALDWNEIIITNDDEVVNGKVRDRMILVTGEKGEDGVDGRGIVSIRRSHRSGNDYYFTVEYTDGTKSVFEIDVPQGGGGSDINTLVFAEDFNPNRHYDVGDYVWYDSDLWRFEQEHQAETPWNPYLADQKTITYEFVDYLHLNGILGEIIAPEFDRNEAYSVGDYVIHDNKLYIFASNHIAGAIWDSSLVIEKNITEQFIDYYKLNSRLDKYAKTNVIAEDFDAQESYAVGDYVNFQGKLYRFTQAHIGTAWNSAHVVEVTVGGELLPDAPSDSKTYGRKNGAWSELDTLVDWGEISGDIEDQTDLIDKINEVVTYYVNDGTGSDSNDGSAEHPFATLAKAISLIPDYRQGTIYAISACNDTDLEIENKNINFVLSNDGMIIVASGGTNLIKNSKVTFSGSGTVIINDVLEVEESDVLFDENAELRVITNQLDTGGITANHSHLIIAGDLTVTMPTTLGAKTICVSALSGSFVAISNQDSYLTAQWAFKSSASVIMVDDTLRSAHWNCAVNFVTEKGGRVYVGTAPEFGDMAFVNDPSAGGVYGRVNGAWSLLTDTFYTESEVDDIADEKQDIIIKTASGSTAEFTTDLSSEFAKCIVNIDPIQETGGYDVGMKNILPPFTSTTLENATLTVDEYGKCIFSKTGSGVVSFSQPNTLTLSAGTYTLSMHNPKSSSGANLGVWLSKYADRSVPGISGAECQTGTVNNHVTFILSETTTVYVHFTSRYSFTNFEFSPMLEVGSTSSNYQPYQHICPISGRTGCNVVVSPTTDAQDGTTYSISFGSAGTVYKATLDVLTGVLTVTHGQIASYSGQTLTGEWISDRDEYAVGTTPTTGAQVVYELATPVIYHLTPVQVMSLIGENHVWADTGDVEIGYFRNSSEELVRYITDKLSQKQDVLTFDDVPTANSTNPVKSGGVKTALDAKQNTLTFDTVPTENSTNPVTSDGIKTALDGKSDPVTGTVSGSIVTLTDATDAPVSDMVVAIEPVQEGSGDPSPTNVRAITGWDVCNISVAGKNLLKNDTVTYPYTKTGITLTKNQDGSVSISGSNSGSTILLTIFQFRGKQVLERFNGKVVVSGGNQQVNNAQIYVTYYRKDGSWIGTAHDLNGFVFRPPSDAYIASFLIRIVSNANDVDGITLYPQIEFGTKATAYEPYNGSTCSVSFGSAGTVYGGNYNPKTGVLTVDRACVVIDHNSEISISTTYNPNFQGVFYIALDSDRYGVYKDASIIPAMISNYMVATTYNGIRTTSDFWRITHTNVGKNVAWTAPYNTLADMKSYLQSNPLQVVYELASPLTFQLSPAEVRILSGLCNVWADTGNVSLTYWKVAGEGIAEAVGNASTNAKLSDEQTRKMITVSEASMTASKNYAIGDLLIADNQLLRATANIASGSTITIGTSGNTEVIDIATIITELKQRISALE